MNKKINKLGFLILLSLSFFFSFSIVSKAATAHAKFPNNYNDIYYNVKGVTTSDGTLKNRDLGDMGIFYVKDGSNLIHVYCIEPGSHIIPEGHNAIKISDFYDKDALTDTQLKNNKFLKNDNDREIRKKMKIVLSWATKLTKDQINKGDRSAYDKVFAAQGLLWEVMTGERTSFKDYKPDKALAKGFYNVISKNTNTKAIFAEYKRLVYDIYNSYYKNPGSGNIKFYAKEKSKTIQMSNWDGEKFSLTINDPNFKYWQVLSNDGLTTSMKSSSITISSKDAISKDNPKTVEIYINTPRKYNYKESGKGNAFTAYVADGKQDVLTVNATQLLKYLNVYTPTYQLKIIKKDENGNYLKDVKFNICIDSTCTKKIDTVTTNENGVAEYKKITKPGTYYVKEVEALPGYEKASTDDGSIVVKKENMVGTNSFATKTIINSRRIFNLEKYTIDANNNKILLDDGCGTSEYTGPTFRIIDKNGAFVNLKKLTDGKYEVSNNGTSEINTCNGTFEIYKIPEGKYTVEEIKPPSLMQLPENNKWNIVIEDGRKNSIQITNGFAGIEFQKKDENGNLLSGGKFVVQKKENGIYKDIMLQYENDGVYVYNEESGDYIFETDDGTAYIGGLPTGEYRIVEREAPNGYEKIEDKNSNANVIIKDNSDYYLVELINSKTNIKGSEASAELIVTITTGRKILNYTLIFTGLIGLLVILVILRKKIKK